MKISEVAKKYGLSISTLHYYEKEGLLPKIEKNQSGDRIYKKSDLEWLDIISCMRQTGMSIKDLKHYVSLCGQGVATVTERLEIIQNKKAEIESMMEQLQKNYKKICQKEEHYLKKISVHKDAINPISRTIDEGLK